MKGKILLFIVPIYLVFNISILRTHYSRFTKIYRI